MKTGERAQLVKAKFKEIFGVGGGKITLVRAPGRVNLIGEHTDYNDGFVLPIAINQEMIMAFQPRLDNSVCLYSYNFSSSHQFPLDGIKYETEESWANYVKGVIHVFQEREISLSGMNIVLEGNIPIGAGLSSSAAIEVATAVGLQLLSGFTMEPVEIVKLCQKAENEFVGVNCGIMDQFVSLLGKKDKALFLDCRSLDYEPVPLPNPEHLRIVVCNTGVRRELSGSEYNKRRRECQEGVSHLKKRLPEIKALRDVPVRDFEKYGDSLPETIKRRCKHIVEENERVTQSVASLKESNLRRFGSLMNESHQSLKDNYEVSCRELDLMVDIARNIDGVLGARMTGAGFGGCTVNLVEEGKVERFQEMVKEKYWKETKIHPEIYILQAEEGAGEILNKTGEKR